MVPFCVQTDYGFPKESYETVFESKGEPELSRKVVQLLEAVCSIMLSPLRSTWGSLTLCGNDNLKVNIPARLTIESEPRGRDGRGFSGPGLGSCFLCLPLCSVI